MRIRKGTDASRSASREAGRETGQAPRRRGAFGTGGSRGQRIRVETGEESARGTGRDTARATKARRVSEPGTVESLLADRLVRLIAGLGNNRLAGLLGVSASQPSRWRKGEERISA